MRPIDADRLKRVLIAFFTGAHLELPHISKVIDFLDNAPTIGAEPVRHGRWISNDPYVGWHCSSCERNNDYAFIWDYEDSKYVLQDCYCPNCGAKMDEVVK